MGVAYEQHRNETVSQDGCLTYQVRLGQRIFEALKRTKREIAPVAPSDAFRNVPII